MIAPFDQGSMHHQKHIWYIKGSLDCGEVKIEAVQKSPTHYKWKKQIHTGDLNPAEAMDVHVEKNSCMLKKPQPPKPLL